MNKSQIIQYINAQAITPDQLLTYVSAVSDVQSELMGEYLLHSYGDNLVFVGYNLQDPNNLEMLDKSIEKALVNQDAQSITVLAPIRPKIAPHKAISTEQDAYWFIPLPIPKLNFKVRNMLNRCQDEIYITKTARQGAWTGKHQELMLEHIRNKKLEAGLCSILQRLERYLLSSQDVELFSAYSKENQELLAYAIGDFSSFNTAFYMFAIRKENALPGVADTLLYELLNEAEKRGYAQCNLGLGINDGIRFFKQKWGAKPSLPLIQTSWQLENQKKSWLERLLD